MSGDPWLEAGDPGAGGLPRLDQRQGPGRAVSGIQRQTAFLDALYNKIRLYGIYNEDVLGWIDLSQSGVDDLSEWVYPVPLEQLP